MSADLTPAARAPRPGEAMALSALFTRLDDLVA